jgi:hypothetical protein
MRKKSISCFKLLALSQVVLACTVCHVSAQAANAPYAVAAPLDQYFMASKDSEVALARSAAPASISDGAEVLLMGQNGYSSAVKGHNGFVCLVERSFAAGTDAPEFWNPKIRGPVCVNAVAAKTYLPVILMRAKLVLAGKSEAEISQAVRSAFDSKELPSLEPGGMSYMLSKDQYLSDDGGSWHPHMMWFISGDSADSWGANLTGSPALASNDPDGRMTIVFVKVGNWSDGTPVPVHGRE